MSRWLLRVSAPHFVAGAVWDKSGCIQAAPILRWMRGKQPNSVRAYLRSKAWSYEWIPLSQKK